MKHEIGMERVTVNYQKLQVAIVLMTVLMTPWMVSAQNYFRSYNSAQGLADNTVYCIKQDLRGYLWIGTANGLCRFDGMHFATYVNDAHDVTSLQCNIVRDVMPVDSGIWAATDTGLDFYSFTDGLFHHCEKQGKVYTDVEILRFNHFVKTQHNLFAVDNGGNVYRHKNGYLYETVGQGKQRYDALAFFHDNLLLAAGSNGLFVLNEQFQQVDHLPFSAPITSLVNLYYSQNKSMAFLGYGIGYESRAFRIENNRIKPCDAYVPPSLMATCDLGNFTVFGIDGGGLVFDDGEKHISYTPSNSNISGDAVYSLYVDRHDNLWTGTYRMGLNLYSERFRWFNLLNRANHSLSYDIVTAIVPDNHHLYLGLDGGGMEIYQPATGEYTTITASNSTLPGDNVVSMLRDNDHLWIAIYTKGLVRYSLFDHSIKTYRMPMVDPDANNVWTMCDDSLGNIWIGGSDLFVFNRQTEKITTVDSIKYCMALALQGNHIWVASRYSGLYKVDRRTQKVTAHYTHQTRPLAIPQGELSFVYVDRKGCLWLSTEQGAFCQFDERNGKVRFYSLDDGKTRLRVRSLEECGDYMLLGTANGFYRFHPVKGIFVPLDVDDSVSEFTPHGSAHDHRYMYFGTTKGLVYFDPSNIRLSNACHQVSFTQLTLLTDDRSKTNLYKDQVGVIRLRHDQNFFSVSYSVPELASPEEVQFSCMLVGLENDWREMGHSREVTYTSVPPGDYELLVRCSNADGSWSEPSSLRLHVSPPWYLTWWAKMLWGLLILALGYLVLQLYLRNLHIKHQVQLAEVEKESERKLNNAKMDFYTSITHELRTPVFLIAAQLEEIMENAKDTVRVPYSYLASLRRNALRLNELVSRVIDFRKVGAQNLSLNLQQADVIAFFSNKTEAFTDMFRQKDITYDFKASAPQIIFGYDALKLELIVSNLLSNAFKYTKRGGHVTFAIHEMPEKVVFAVSDDGIGIDERVRDTIFESFFRSRRGKEQGEGDGLGLSYVKSLVELHGGKISVESKMGAGSTFEFFLPKGLDDNGGKPQALLLDEPLHKNNPAATHTILIVDDERETVELLERYLEKDFRVVKAYDGEEGLEKAGECLPDVVLIDLMMPRMSGLEMLTRLKHDKKLHHVKVIVFTAKTAEDDMLSAFDNGADVYLTKPVSLKLLRKRINKLITPEPASLLTTTSMAATSPESAHKTFTKEEQLFLLRCREVIDSNLQNPDFNIAFLAEQVGMSHSPLYKKLKQLTGMSLIEFVNDYRIYKAVQLFREGETNVEAVAEAVGINDIKNFRTLFKRKMQMTPKQFVQSL